VADVEKAWTPAQTTLAFDMLGTPLELRDGKKLGESLDFEGNLAEAGGDLAIIARREIADLKARCEQISPLDEVARTLALADLGDDTDPELVRIRRTEATLHSRLRWFTRQLQAESPTREPRRGLLRKWLPDPAPAELKPPEPLKPPEIRPEPVALSPFDHPPFDLEPDEFPPLGAVADIPKIVKDRRAKARKKAEARRDAKRRKVEKLRA
jgi:hypothetical protein